MKKRFVDETTELHCVNTTVTDRFNDGSILGGTFWYLGKEATDEVQGYWYTEEGFTSIAVGVTVITTALVAIGTLIGVAIGRHCK